MNNVFKDFTDAKFGRQLQWRELFFIFPEQNICDFQLIDIASVFRRFCIFFPQILKRKSNIKQINILNFRQVRIKIQKIARDIRADVAKIKNKITDVDGSRQAQ